MASVIVPPVLHDNPEPPMLQPDSADDLAQIRKQIDLMIRYAYAEGLPIDDQTRTGIAQYEGSSSDLQLEGMLKLHSGLAKIVAPATPCSLDATEPVKGFLGSLRRPALIAWMVLIALVAAAGFISTAVQFIEKETPGAPVSATQLKTADRTGSSPAYTLRAAQFSTVADASGGSAAPPSPRPTFRDEFNWIFAAALGAVFYVLFAAHQYVKERTFDPKYNSVYVIRFLLGVLAGLILANIARTQMFTGSPSFRDLGPSVVAMLGGFSTEAVYQILQRLVDVLLAAVRGDNSGDAKTKAGQTAQKELLVIAEDPAVAGNAALLGKVHAALQKVTR